MRLDRPGAPHIAPLAPEDWTMDMDRQGSMLSADIKRRNQHMCRVSIACEGLSEDEQRTALAEKARAWIADYLSRSHAGPTAFGEL